MCLVFFVNPPVTAYAVPPALAQGGQEKLQILYILAF